MRLAERKLLQSPRNLASFAQGPPPPRRPALAAGWTSAAGAGAGDMERPVEPKGHRRSEENGPERPRRRGTPTHPPARRSPASPLRFAPALLLTPRSLLSPPPGEESLPAPPLPPHPCCPPPPHPLVQVSTLEANLGQGPWRDVVGSLLAQLMDASPPSPPRRSGVVAEQGGDNGVNPRDRVSACRLGPGEEAAALALVPAGQCGVAGHDWGLLFTDLRGATAAEQDCCNAAFGLYVRWGAARWARCSRTTRRKTAV